MNVADGFLKNQVSRSGSVPPNSRDTLYQGLPDRVKSALRARLQSFPVFEEVPQKDLKLVSL